MSDDIEKEKTKAELDDLGRLVDRYAQSRSLPLLILIPIMVFNVLLLVGMVELKLKYGALIGWWGWRTILTLVFLCSLFLSTWLPFKLFKRYAGSFYRKEGDIELQKEKVPVWTWIVYGVTFVGPAFLHEFNIMPVRWALTTSLVSIGVFMLYLAKKHKEIALGLVWGLLCLIQATATAAGLPPLFAGRHSYFASLMTYIIGGGLITAVVVHIYNRKVLRKIKQMRPFGEQEPNKSDS
jgi:hypothetical protein